MLGAPSYCSSSYGASSFSSSSSSLLFHLLVCLRAWPPSSPVYRVLCCQSYVGSGMLASSFSSYLSSYLCPHILLLSISSAILLASTSSSYLPPNYLRKEDGGMDVGGRGCRRRGLVQGITAQAAPATAPATASPHHLLLH